MLFMALSRYSAISNIAGNGITVNTTKLLILGLIYINNHLYWLKFTLSIHGYWDLYGHSGEYQVWNV